MAKTITADEAAARFGVTPRRFRMLCSERRVPGARFIGGRWFVPENFDVTPGARGPALNPQALRTIRRLKKVLRDLDKTEALAKKVFGDRYAPGKIPLGRSDWRVATKRKGPK